MDINPEDLLNDPPILLSKERSKETSPKTHIAPKAAWAGDIHPAHLACIITDSVRDLHRAIELVEDKEAAKESIVEAAITLAAIRTAQRISMEMSGLVIDSSYNEDGTRKDEENAVINNPQSFSNNWKESIW